MEHLDFAHRPDALSQLRACKNCRLVKTAAQFSKSFCDNCLHEHPESKSQAACREYVETRTTSDYLGICSLLQYQGSWVAMQLDMRTRDEERTPLKPGIYAITLPREEAYAAAEQDEAESSETDDDDDGDNDGDDGGGGGVLTMKGTDESDHNDSASHDNSSSDDADGT